MRTFSFTNKKVRGVPRRMRALKRWAEGFEGYFPEGLTEGHMYHNYKVAVHESLVEGKQATADARRQAAQSLIDACAHLIAAKPASADPFRVLATICLPDMFSSEVCIYSDRDYYHSKISPAPSKNGTCTPITDRKLSEEWGLNLPAGIGEYGLALDFRGHEDPDYWYVGEVWYFGEVEVA